MALVAHRARADPLERQDRGRVGVGALQPGDDVRRRASSDSSAYIARSSPRCQAAAKAVDRLALGGDVAGAADGPGHEGDERRRRERGEAARIGDRVPSPGARAGRAVGQRMGLYVTAGTLGGRDGHRLADRGRRPAAGAVRLGAGIRRGRARAAGLRDRRLRRDAPGPAAARRRAPLALVSGLRPGRGADRGHGLRPGLRGGGRTLARPGAIAGRDGRRRVLRRRPDRVRGPRDHLGARRAGARQRRRGAARGAALDDPAAPQRGAAAVERADRGAGAARSVPAHRRPRGARARADRLDRPRARASSPRPTRW